MLLSSNVIICSKRQGLFTAIDKYYETGIHTCSEPTIRGQDLQFISAVDSESIDLIFWFLVRIQKLEIAHTLTNSALYVV